MFVLPSNIPESQSVDGVIDAEHILEYAALHRGFMARLPGHILQRHSPRPLSAVAGWSLRPILFTPPGIRFPQRGVVIFGEVSCLTGVFTASHCPVHPVAMPAITVECSPKTTSVTSSARLSVIAGGAVSIAVRPLG